MVEVLFAFICWLRLKKSIAIQHEINKSASENNEACSQSGVNRCKELLALLKTLSIVKLKSIAQRPCVKAALNMYKTAIEMDKY